MHRVLSRGSKRIQRSQQFTRTIKVSSYLKRLINKEISTVERSSDGPSYSACKIRAYIAAKIATGKASSEWVEWAKAKADWLDPTIRAEDPFFGVRQHEQSEECKKLKKKGYWY